MKVALKCTNPAIFQEEAKSPEPRAAHPAHGAMRYTAHVTTAVSEEAGARRKTLIVAPPCTAYGLAVDIISMAD